jgi:hypothetical protein
MANVLMGAQNVNTVPSNCRIQAMADPAMVKHSVIASTESGQRASSQSGHTHQQLQISQNNDLNAGVEAAAADGAATNKQPASPDSVNAGHPVKAPAQAASSAPSEPVPADASVRQVAPAHSSPAQDSSALQADQVVVQQDQQQDSQDVEMLEPLAPPEAADGPEAQAEYETYLERWSAGNTLRQRWHRYGQMCCVVHTGTQCMIRSFEVCGVQGRRAAGTSVGM